VDHLDARTGLYNRAFFETALSSEIEQARRYGRSLSLVIFDVDGFKRINDALGHAAGNMLLTEIGRILQRNLRGSDIACRIGGDEFALILPETTLQGSEVVFARLLRLVRQGSTGRFGSEITISGGGGECESDEAQGLFVRVDDAVYRAKKQGRGSIAAAGPPAPLPARRSGVGWTGYSPTPAEAAGRADVTWEYLVEPADIDRARLDELGRQGWELAAAAKGRLFFKRRG
jgi:diguanylate cyclase (GGDEF)-like protein